MGCGFRIVLRSRRYRRLDVVKRMSPFTSSTPLSSPFPRPRIPPLSSTQAERHPHAHGVAPLGGLRHGDKLRPGRLIRRTLAFVLALGLVVSAGCGGDPEPSLAPSLPPSPTPTLAPTSTPFATPTPISDPDFNLLTPSDVAAFESLIADVMEAVSADRLQGIPDETRSAVCYAVAVRPAHVPVITTNDIADLIDDRRARFILRAFCALTEAE